MRNGNMRTTAIGAVFFLLFAGILTASAAPSQGPEIMSPDGPPQAHHVLIGECTGRLEVFYQEDEFPAGCEFIEARVLHNAVATCVTHAWEAHERGDDRAALAWLGRADEATRDNFCIEP